MYIQGSIWQVTRCKIVLTEWFDHGLLSVEAPSGEKAMGPTSTTSTSVPSTLQAGPVLPRPLPSVQAEFDLQALDQRPTWHLKRLLLRQQEYYERLDSLLLITRDGQVGPLKRATEPMRCWEELKGRGEAPV